MATPFRSALTLLQQYAEYHRDRRNIATHLVGVPMIVFGVSVMLARVQWAVAGGTFSLAWLVMALAGAWYLTRGHLGIGVATTVAVAALTALAHLVHNAPLLQWLGWGLGMFVVGWIIQFVGHHYEGRKPAFVDDMVGLLVGPMFVVLEVGAAVGWFKDLTQSIEAHAGPSFVRNMAR